MNFIRPFNFIESATLGKIPASRSLLSLKRTFLRSAEPEYIPLLPSLIEIVHLFTAIQRLPVLAPARDEAGSNPGSNQQTAEWYPPRLLCRYASHKQRLTNEGEEYLFVMLNGCEASSG